LNSRDRTGQDRLQASETSNKLTTRQGKRGLEKAKIMRGDEEQVERDEPNEK